MGETKSKKPLRVLMVEDSIDDEALILRELHRGGFEVTSVRVQTAVAMREALAEAWDLVLSDFSMPDFSGPAAIEILAESGREIPLIIVSGTIGEETAVGALQAGASDFVVKQRLARLVPAIERALRDNETRTARHHAEQASLSKSRFLASMSHELRTPLNAIIGFADILLSGDVPAGSPTHDEFLGDILKSGHHLLRLINDVLDLSKVEADRLDFHPEAQNLAVISEEVANVVRAAATAKGVSLIVEPGDVGTVILDGVRLKQVLFNYLSNATKFTGRGGKVTLRARPISAEMFRIEVQDTGVGIAPKDLARLFLEFEQVGVQDDNPTGTGLGLALAKRLVEAQGGRVGVESIAGRGSTFFAVLPRDGSRAANASSARPGGAHPPPSIGGSAPRIITIDDDPASLALLHATLAPLGYAVASCSTAEAALARAERERPVAIVLDLCMPGVDGHAFLERYRAIPENRDVPIVLWTAKDLGKDEETKLRRHVVAVKLKGRDGPIEIAAAIKAIAPPPSRH
jgi:signal transduction histidine kinase